MDPLLFPVDVRLRWVGQGHHTDTSGFVMKSICLQSGPLSCFSSSHFWAPQTAAWREGDGSTSSVLTNVVKSFAALWGSGCGNKRCQKADITPDVERLASN